MRDAHVAKCFPSFVVEGLCFVGFHPLIPFLESFEGFGVSLRIRPSCRQSHELFDPLYVGVEVFVFGAVCESEHGGQIAHGSLRHVDDASVASRGSGRAPERARDGRVVQFPLEGQSLDVSHGDGFVSGAFELGIFYGVVVRVDACAVLVHFEGQDGYFVVGFSLAFGEDEPSVSLVICAAHVCREDAPRHVVSFLRERGEHGVPYFGHDENVCDVF